MAFPFGLFSKKKNPEPQGQTGKRVYRAPRDKTGNWVVMGAQQERAPAALPMIRARARDLAQNNPYASRAVSVLTSHAVGIGIRASIRGDDEFESDFNAWASSTECDYERRLTFYGIQNLATRAMFEAGDSLIIMREKRNGDQLRLTLQVIDADQLDTGASPRLSGNRVFGGVEVYPSGQIYGYHVRARLEETNSVFIPRDDAIHLLELLYPGQVRGIPRGAQALTRLNGVEDFITAALARAKVEACLTAFVTTPHADVGVGLLGEEADEDDGFLLPENLEPGMIVPLNPGEDVKVAQPPSSGGMKDYVKLNLQSVAAAYGVTYDQLSSDLEGSNFSSHKAGKLEFNRSIDNLRTHTILPAFRRIVDRFRGVWELNNARVTNASYSLVPPRREDIEPLKSAQTTNLKLLNGTLTWSDAVREEGKDPDDQIAELAELKDKFKKAGLSFTLNLGPVKIEELGTLEPDDDGDEEDVADDDQVDEEAEEQDAEDDDEDVADDAAEQRAQEMHDAVIQYLKS